MDQLYVSKDLALHQQPTANSSSILGLDIYIKRASEHHCDNSLDNCVSRGMEIPSATYACTGLANRCRAC